MDKEIMDALILNPTYNSPSVNFNALNGILEISGRSIPERANVFYSALIQWVKEYASSKPTKTEVNVNLDYLNSSSHKYIIELLEKLEPVHSDGSRVQVNWYYEEDDDEIKETGKECSELVKIPFNLIPKEIE